MEIEEQILKKVHPSTLIAGVDEVGRGALFGPVVAAAIILPASQVTELNEIAAKDSKKVSPKRRTEYAELIKAMVTDAQIGAAQASEIDEINILQASLRAMQRSVQKLTPPPMICLVDGRFALPDLHNIQQVNLKQGDARSRLIAAASIVAKVHRDNLIIRDWAEKYPQYHLAQNKGYGTAAHRSALEKYGPSPQHRRSFRPCRLATF
ncbi:ribonuclease HII [Euhalothece natronophila Z-M001]|uniref:Ribonuclease HII n=1 Tax=Euhalothece natronophila Z-M001 TaxID=522448 RepID=A0A5B8NJ06_9CHRO|nr:ribonuclease HII [Euhalothece natronophila]QDZ38948.1 ribonuclease HII [Euhalothece natronophila Z-M001]